MAKYIMNVEVEAEQFLPEKDQIPKGVQSDGPNSPRTDSRASWMLLTTSGGSYIKNGDYVITAPDGSRYIMARDIFEKTYTLKK